uniref:G-protein coupled receptors family 3 profile domain-containing protein n=1 Tax=Leptobrachium leishanense TaxID=445787 RepID=A0A8C5MYS1_9ANUR
MVVILYKVTWHFILLLLIPVFHSGDQRCRLPVTELNGMTQPGDIMIGVLLPIHLGNVYQEILFNEKPPRTRCTMFHFESYQQLQAMTFAVEEINENPDILPNITLGFQAYDSCAVLQKDLQGALQVLTGHDRAIPNYRCVNNVPLSSIIGSAISTHSILVAHILGLYNYPQVWISHLSTSALLSDHRKFPSFFRTVPSDIFQSRRLAQLLLYFGWTWVGLIAADNDYGQQGIHLVQQELIRAGACVAFTENILTSHPGRNADHIVKVMKASTARVIVIYATEIEITPIFNEMVKQGISEKLLVASEGWSTSTLFSQGTFSTLLSGTVGLALQSGTISGFRDFLNMVHPSTSLGSDWLKIFWELSFNCKFMDSENQTGLSHISMKDCTGLEDLGSIQNAFNDISSLRNSYSVYTAVHVVAEALEDLNNCTQGEGPFSKRFCGNISNFAPWQLLHYIKKVRFTLSSGREIYFDENGDPPAIYDIVNWQLSSSGAMNYVKVGSYDMTLRQAFTINTSAIKWTSKDQQVPVSVCSQGCPLGFRKATIKGEPVCCFECIPCPQGEISNHTEKSRCFPKPIEYLSYEEPLGVMLASSNAISSLVPFTILMLFKHFNSTPIVKASNYSLSCLLLTSLTFCFLCSLAFIGYPQRETCLLRQVSFGMVFALCISCILAKTIMVVFAFMATKPDSNLKKWTSHSVSRTIIFISTFLQFILCVTWLSIKPPFPELDTKTEPKLIILHCNEGLPIAFWCMLGYLGLLASISLTVAFFARRLPDIFNEAKFITFSMLAFLSVWVSYIPASLSAQGKYTVAMEIFAILASSWALVICMFAPKCFIILCRPNMNSKEQVMKKTISTID